VTKKHYSSVMHNSGVATFTCTSSQGRREGERIFCRLKLFRTRCHAQVDRYFTYL